MLFFVGISFFLFFIGAALGSFINVVIYRSARQEDWVRGRSRCDYCKQPLAWYDNVPLLSFLVLQGKTRCCGQPLSITHPVVELLIGSLFVWWYWGGALFFNLATAPLQTIQPLFWLLIGVLLAAVLVTDWLYLIIPDFLVGALLILSFFYRLLLVAFEGMQWQDFLSMLGATALAAAFFLFLFLVTKGKGFGFGDVKLVVPLGLILGWQKLAVALFLAFVLGASFGVALLVAKRKTLRQVIPFGPFLVLATYISLVFGAQIFSWYVSLL